MKNYNEISKYERWQHLYKQLKLKLTFGDYPINFLTFTCKDQIYLQTFLTCEKTVSKVKHHVVYVTTKTWKFVLLSPESSVFFK